ncbi:hypothetical protein HUX88_25800 [Duganella sp. BJB1802]|uniref:hypothetical protein n=1 Tax=Duganella sp. BJB1802 TaxID=2744575 RepID=UPI001592DCD9|nr:hypothetical protein [Duganella sp. BJB1802]NVD73918.1 hypothetical protein [Duganella sp. BJB1802]
MLTWAARLALAACAPDRWRRPRRTSDDGLHPYAGLLYSYDDNLFPPARQPGYDAPAPTPRASW